MLVWGNGIEGSFGLRHALSVMVLVKKKMSERQNEGGKFRDKRVVAMTISFHCTLILDAGYTNQTTLFASDQSRWSAFKLNIIRAYLSSTDQQRQSMIVIAVVKDRNK